VWTSALTRTHPWSTVTPRRAQSAALLVGGRLPPGQVSSSAAGYRHHGRGRDAGSTRPLAFSPDDPATGAAAPAELPVRAPTGGCGVCRGGGGGTGVSRWRGRRGTSAAGRG